MLIQKVCDRVYGVCFETVYEVTMYFWRYQEFHECMNDAFRGKAFTLIDYMEWYHKIHGKGFSYPVDWAGFNLPGSVIRQVHDLGIPDPNKYDAFMLHLYEMIALRDSSDFYIMGYSVEDVDVSYHEFAHALFNTNANYRTEMIELIASLPAQLVAAFKSDLHRMGYPEVVCEDEMQAWLSTGLHSEVGKEKYKKYAPKFRKIFRRYKEQIALWL